MKILQAFKFELMPNGEQQKLMRRFAGCCRFVYNKALSIQIENHEAENSYIRYVEMAAQLVAWKKNPDSVWLNDAPSQALQHALKHLESAYKNFFANRTNFPRFAKRGARDSFHYPQGFKLDEKNNRIFLPKLGWTRYRNSRAVVGEIRNMTVSCRNGKWFVAIQTQREMEAPLPKSTTAVGVDVGIARFATFSDGSYVEPLNSFKHHQARLVKHQRRMSKKTKFSNNWKKEKAKIQKVHSQIANARKDFLHKLTTTISKNHALVCIEDLQVRNMSKSSKGNCDQPGKKVRQKSGLNRSILDQGWGEFRRQLGYKLEWNGGVLLAVAPQNTSITCPCCMHVSKDNRKTQSQFACVVCVYKNHADVVGAINILERGHRLLACGEPMRLGRSEKQE